MSFLNFIVLSISNMYVNLVLTIIFLIIKLYMHFYFFSNVYCIVAYKNMDVDVNV